MSLSCSFVRKQEPGIDTKLPGDPKSSLSMAQLAVTRPVVTLRGAYDHLAKDRHWWPLFAFIAAPFLFLKWLLMGPPHPGTGPKPSEEKEVKTPESKAVESPSEETPPLPPSAEEPESPSEETPPLLPSAEEPESPSEETPPLLPSAEEPVPVPKPRLFQSPEEARQQFADLQLFAGEKLAGQREEFEGLLALVFEKSPEMVEGIFANCLWAKGKMRDDFILSMALASLKMERDDVFADAPEELVPSIFFAHRMASCSFALFGAATEEKLKKTQTRFDDWIDGQSAALSLAPDKTTPVETRYFLWDKWVIGYDLPSCRSAICSTVLIRSNPCLSTNEADNPVDPVLEKLYAAYLPLEYAYQQGLFRHSKKFPGVEDGNPPTILGIRGISHAGKEKIFSQSEEDGLHDYPASTQLAAESWGMGGGANAFLGKNRSNPAVFKDNAVFWGKIPIYAVLTSDPIQAQKDGHGWHHAQREMVVLATDDRTVELRQKMPWEEYRGITYEQLHRQYGDNLPYCPEVHENGWVDYVNKKN